MKQILTLEMRLLSDTIFSSGYSVPGGADISLRTNAAGWPVLVGATLKGLLRESMTNWLCWTGGSEETLNALLGSESREAAGQRRLVVGDLTIQSPPADPEQCISTRAFTALAEDGLVADGSLRLAVCLNGGLCFGGVLLCEEQDTELVTAALQNITAVGLMRNRGFGSVKFTIANKRALRPAAAVPPCELLHYRLRLLTPMAVSWLSRSGAAGAERNYTETRSYLPGSSVRGMVVQTLLQQQPQWCQEHLTELLGDEVRFGNALPACGARSGLPMPKGFYASRDGKRQYHILQQEVEPGDKRAAAGSYCVPQKGELLGYSPAVSSSLRSSRGTRGDKKLFTVRRLNEGQTLEGYIMLDNPALAPVIARAFGEMVWLGADRHAGSGLCEVEVLEAVQQPHWQSLGYRKGDAVPAILYMMLLAPTCMEQNGQPVGLNEEELAHLLGVNTVKLRRCATSVVELGGVNTTLCCRVPAQTMYDAGSVFCLECSPAPTLQAVQQLQNRGIGMRRGEGCGQVLFVRDFAALRLSEKDATRHRVETPAAQARRARCRWLLAQQSPGGGVSPSQLGMVQALCEQAILENGDTTALEEHFRHNLEDRGARMKAKYAPLWHRVQQLLDMSTPLEEIVGGPVCSDTKTERLRLLCDWIDLSRKEAGN